MKEQENALANARRVLEDLEQRRETVASVFADAEQKRAGVVFSAATGDAKAKAEADRLSKELTRLASDAADIEAALATARANLATAQAAVDAVKRGEREAEAREIVTAQLQDSARIDAMFSEIATLLQTRAVRCARLRKIGMLNTGRPIQHPSRIVDAMVAAGLREFAGGISKRAQRLADADAVNLPFGRKVSAAA